MPLSIPLLDDVTWMLNDCAGSVQVISGSVAGSGILDQPQQLIQDGMVITTDWTLLCRADLFAGLIYGDPLTAGGSNFIVREARVMYDGLTCELSLEKVVPDTAVPGRHPTNTFGLSDLADVAISDAQEGDLLVNDGANWVNVNEVDGGGP